MFNRPVTFAIIVVLFLIAIAMLTNSSQTVAFTLKDAVDTSLKDAQQYAMDNYPNAETYIQVESAANISDKWKIEMFLSIAPHSRCPAMQKLDYELFPLTRRNETVVAYNDCHARPISVAPDAIADSYANSAGARQAYSVGYLACAFMLPVTDVGTAAKYCPQIDSAAIADFSTRHSLREGNWVVQWFRKSSDNYLVGLDSSGTVIAESNYALSG